MVTTTTELTYITGDFINVNSCHHTKSMQAISQQYNNECSIHAVLIQLTLCIYIGLFLPWPFGIIRRLVSFIFSWICLNAAHHQELKQNVMIMYIIIIYLCLVMCKYFDNPTTLRHISAYIVHPTSPENPGIIRSRSSRFLSSASGWLTNMYIWSDFKTSASRKIQFPASITGMHQSSMNKQIFQCT